MFHCLFLKFLLQCLTLNAMYYESRGLVFPFDKIDRARFPKRTSQETKLALKFQLSINMSARASSSAVRSASSTRSFSSSSATRFPPKPCQFHPRFIYSLISLTHRDPSSHTVSSKAALYAKNKKQAAQGDVSHSSLI